MRVNIVNKSDFGIDRSLPRLDPEFVDAELMDEERVQALCNGSTLAEVVQDPSLAIMEGRSLPEWTRYIAIDSVDQADGLCFETTLRSDDLPSRAKYLVRAGDVLVSNVRPNRGVVALIDERTEGAIASSGFTVLRTKETATVAPFYLFAFLKTEWARNQLVRRNRGSMYPAVLADDVLQVSIPLPPKTLTRRVESLVEQALVHQREFFEWHLKMNKQLDDFLRPYGSPPDPMEFGKTAIEVAEIKASEIFGKIGAKRFDAEFFRRGYAEFDARCRALGRTFLLGDFYTLSSGTALRPGADEIAYLKQAVLTNVGVNWSAATMEEGSQGPAPTQAREQDILLACTAHEIYYVGRKVDFVREVPSDMSHNTCVPDLMIIRPRADKPATIHGSYVAAFLRHPAGLHQVQRCIRGLRGGHVYRDDLSHYVRVPIPSKEWLNRFESIAVRAEASRNNAKTVMAEGVKTVTEHLATVLRRRPAMPPASAL